MKNPILIILLFLSYINGYSQTTYPSANFIITVDGKVVIGELAKIALAFKTKDSLNQIVHSTYIPGNLSFGIDENMIFSDSLELTFNYYETCNNKHVIYKYEVNLPKVWLSYSYIVLRLYNTSKSKYKKIYYPLEGKSYTYEWDLPTGSIERIKKNYPKPDCER